MIRKTRCAVAALACIAVASPAFAKSCYTPQDIRAMQVRQLHYELMVAALKCNSAEADFRSKWNVWVTRFGGTMNSNAAQLKSMFARMGSGQSGMDRYVTQLSNDASMRAQHVEEYCDSQYKLFDTVLTLSPTEMESWAATSIEKPMATSSACSTAPSPVKQAKAEKTEKPKKASPEKASADKPKSAARTETKG